ncbi:hypothetical protein [Trichothermofontia sp.]
MNTNNQRLEKIIIIFISICFVIWSTAFIYRSSFIAVDGKRYFCLFDDAMISMRYAWNFSHGIGLVWNEGERIQGYTNLLMTLLMSFATLVADKSNAVLFIQISGVGFMLLAAYISMQIADYIGSNQNIQKQALIRVLVFISTLSYYPLVYWSLMGMETGMLTVCLLLGILFTFKYTENRNISNLFASFIFFWISILNKKRLNYYFFNCVDIYFLGNLHPNTKG